MTKDETLTILGNLTSDEKNISTITHLVHGGTNEDCTRWQITIH